VTFDASFHRRRAADSLIDAREVVMHEVQGDHMAMIRELLRVPIGQSGKPSHAHPHRKILALNSTRRDMSRIGIPADGIAARTHTLSWTVARLWFAGRIATIDLHEHRVVHFSDPCFIDSGKIRPMTVCRQLNTIAKPARQVQDKFARRAGIAPSDVPAGYELRFRVDGRPRPNVAITKLSLKFDWDVLLLGVAERPNFIALDAATIQVAEMLILVLLAGSSYIREQLEDGMLCRVRNPASGINRHPFDQAGDDLCATLYAHAIHNA
jgi:hypothetical protein